MLPEIKSLDQPMTAIVPNMAFQENTKVLISHNEKEVKIQLLELLAKTPSFSQFEVKVLTPDHSLFGMDGDDSDDANKFDTIWSTL